MGCFYISIEKNIKGFNFYKALWKAHGVDGIRADAMTEGIKKAIEIEKSNTDELFFIDIVADDIDFLPQLKLLSEQTNAPILIATSAYSEDEHHKALNNGADFYGGYCENPVQNIDAVLSVIHSIDQRAKKRKSPHRILAHGDIMIAADSHKAFIKDAELCLSSAEMKIMQYLMINQGNILPHDRILQAVYNDNDEASPDILYSAIKRLRKKIRAIDPFDYIQTVRDVGYRLVTKSR